MSNAIDDFRHDHEAGVVRKPNDSTLDTTRIDDVRIGAVRPLISPALLLERAAGARRPSQALVESSRAAIADVLHGRDDRLVVVVGPCSIHDHDQAIEYAQPPEGAWPTSWPDDLLIVMRVYFEKPRTTVGWKGYINDPRLDGSFRINEGLRRARELLLEIAALGLPAGTEFLDLLSPQYIADLIAWGAIGARTTESQSHRQLASGLSLPGRLQERHRRRRARSRPTRSSRPRARACLHGHDQDGPGRDLRDPRQRRLPRDPARRQGAQLRRRRRRGSLRGAAHGRPARAGDDRLSRTPIGASSTERQIEVAADVAAQIAARRAAHHRRDDREPSARRAGRT